MVLKFLFSTAMAIACQTDS